MHISLPLPLSAHQPDTGRSVHASAAQPPGLSLLLAPGLPQLLTPAAQLPGRAPAGTAAAVIKQVLSGVLVLPDQAINSKDAGLIKQFHMQLDQLARARDSKHVTRAACHRAVAHAFSAVHKQAMTSLFQPTAWPSTAGPSIAGPSAKTATVASLVASNAAVRAVLQEVCLLWGCSAAPPGIKPLQTVQPSPSEKTRSSMIRVVPRLSRAVGERGRGLEYVGSRSCCSREVGGQWAMVGLELGRC